MKLKKNHIVSALRFELGKLEREDIRIRVVGMLTQIDKSLAERVAKGLGITVLGAPEQPMNLSIPADGNPDNFQPIKVTSSLQSSKALSMANTVKDTIKTRCIAILAADGVNDTSLNTMKKALEAAGASTKIIAPHLGFIAAANGSKIKADQTFLTAASVLFDAVYVPDGEKSTATLLQEFAAIEFINEAYKHCKAIAADGSGSQLIDKIDASLKMTDNHHTDKNKKGNGVVINGDSTGFINAIAQHRFWEREKML